MSLLDRGPHTVTVIPKTTVPNAYGGRDLIDGTPVEVRGLMIQPNDKELVHALGGQQVVDGYIVIGRGPWPAGIHSTVVWQGDEYDIARPARHYTTGRRTRHFDCVILARTAEVK